MKKGRRILVVDDEPQIHRFLKPSLVVSGFEVETAMSGAEALKKAAATRPDAIVLDLGLPDMDGKQVIEVVRRTSDIPIVVLSARDMEAEKVAALDLGADDYVNKPFAIGEFLARLRSVLRRSSDPGAKEKAIHTLGSIVIDVPAHVVTRSGATVHLTPKEFDLLVLLARHAGRVITHRQILSDVWGPAHGSDTQYLRVFIAQLRQKLEEDPSAPKLIVTEPGVGYRVVDG